jgi:hypothetical protein
VGQIDHLLRYMEPLSKFLEYIFQVTSCSKSWYLRFILSLPNGLAVCFLYSFIEGGARQSRQLTNATTVTSIGYWAQSPI